MGKHIKGFTLAELMGVIVVLGILAVILVPVVDRNLKKGKNITCKTQEKSIIEAAKNCISDGTLANCGSNCDTKGSSCELHVRELVKNGYLEGSSTTTDAPPINPATGEVYDDSTYVLIYNSTGYNYSYELIYGGNDQNTCEE